MKSITLEELSYTRVSDTATTITYRCDGIGWKKLIHFQKNGEKWHMFGTYTEKDAVFGWNGKALRMSTDEACAVAHILLALEGGEDA